LKHVVSIQNRGAEISARALTLFIARAQRAAGVRGEVNVLITDDAAMRELNRRFRRKDKPTDVLSFPAASNGAAGRKELWAGDIAISADIAARSAQELGHSLPDELKILILHGVLHLSGYDHETDNGEMASTEEKLRRALKLRGALTSRHRRNGSPRTSANSSPRHAH
jgi:probable rRNA maturation factor